MRAFATSGRISDLFQFGLCCFKYRVIDSRREIIWHGPNRSLQSLRSILFKVMEKRHRLLCLHSGGFRALEENAGVFEIQYLAFSSFQAKLAAQRQAEMFILNTTDHIQLIREFTQLRLKNMRRWCRTLWQAPAIVPEKSGFLLRPGDGDTKFMLVIHSDAERCGRQITQHDHPI